METMTFDEIIRNNRSYRRFYEDEKIDIDLLRKLVGYARLSASSANIQGLKFLLSADENKNELIFNQLKWASYLKIWKGPEKGERPSAYIVVLADTSIHSTIEIDVGIVAQSILLGAVASGYGGCMIASINRHGLIKALNIHSQFLVPLVIALGKPKEKVLVDDIGSDGRIEYWRDKDNVHHVPKRTLDELIVDF